MLCDMRLLRVVLDTNVLVAASRSRRGASFALLRLLRAGRFTALASVPLLLEYEAVLKRPEHLAAGGRTEAMTDAFLDALCLRCEPVHLFYLWRPRARDPADDMVLETALNGRADHLVTLNIGDFAAAAQFRLDVATPGALLRRLESEAS
jgi:putative PIN family toxin of toxin-antitoxin system